MMPEKIKSVFVFAPDGVLTYTAKCLIQGFMDLGLEVGTNGNLQLTPPDFPSSPFSILPAPVHISRQSTAIHEELVLVDALERPLDYQQVLAPIKSSKPIAFINHMDNANFFDGFHDIPSFVSHYNIYAKRKGQLFPLSFGLSNDIIKLADEVDLTKKQNNFVHNFGLSLNQDVRLSLDFALVENFSKYFPVDFWRKDNIKRPRLTTKEYIEYFARSLGFFAYGGSYYADLMSDRYREYAARYGDHYRFESFTKDCVVFRWDSYRFYECALFACVPLTLDFDKYGLKLHTNPEPWKEYIPIDVATANLLPFEIMRRMNESSNLLHEIGRNARKWVLEHNSPRACASYILTEVQKFYQQHPLPN
ncbi:conserved hypothetical protein [Gammaproteobacteria bacterium]